MDDNLPPSGTPPPLSSSPPPIIVAQNNPERPSSGGRGWKILCLILFLALGASLLSRFGGVTHRPGRAVQQGERLLDEILIEDNGSRNKIAIVEIDGIITSSPMDRSGRSIVDSVQDQLEAAGRDPRVKAVVLKVNSPGGEVLASDEIYNSIRGFQEDFDKPAVASMGSLAASGGYYVSAPCQWIVANEMTITGSIGVIMHGYNYRGLMDKIGLRPNVYKSGEHKDMLSGDRREEEIPEEEREMIQNLIMETYGKFTNIVQEGRQEANRLNQGSGRELSSDWAEYADGRVVSGKQAHEIGLVDELGNFKTAVDRALALADIPDADLIQYQEPFGLRNLFRIFGKAESTAIKIDLGLDFPKLLTGRLYFIAPTTLPQNQ